MSEFCDDGAGMVCSRCRSRLKAGSWPRCPRCHAPRGTGREELADCLECREWPDALSLARFAWLLRPPADDLVHALKYEGWRELAPYMGRCMAAAARAGGWAATGPTVGGRTSRGAEWTVVPVPTTPHRMRERGYNQAALLARVVASELELPLADALLRRAGGGSQTRLSPKERQENVRGAFVAGPAAIEVRDRRVLFVDDVLTTGATAGAAACTLMEAGAREVRLLTFGRALPDRDAGMRQAA